MNRRVAQGWRAIVWLAGLACGAGCWSVPDARDMRDWRARRSAERLEELRARSPAAGSIYIAGDLRLGEALAHALEHNLALKQEREERAIASGRLAASYAGVLPALDWSATYTRRDEELGTTRDGVYSPTRYQDQSRTEVKLTQPLFNGHASAALRAGKLYREWTEAGIRQAEEDVRYEVVAAYYRAVLSAHLLEVNLAALETAERQQADMRARRRQGMASNYDELRAEVEVSNFRAQVLQARNNKDVARTTLLRLIGASPESTVRLVDSIPLVLETCSFDDALQTALACRADLAEAEYALRLQRESVQQARGRYAPELAGYALQAWANPDPHDTSRNRWGDEWQAGLELSLPLFDGFDRRGTLLQEQAKLRQYEIALRDTEEKVVSQIRQLVLSLKTAEEFAKSQSRNLQTAKEALRLVETGLKEGQNTPVEVIDARQALTTASANYYQSLFDHAMARVALQKAMGHLSGRELPDRTVLGRIGAAAGNEEVHEAND